MWSAALFRRFGLRRFSAALDCGAFPPLWTAALFRRFGVVLLSVNGKAKGKETKRRESAALQISA